MTTPHEQVLIIAALNMVDVKGRHHSEIAMDRLIEEVRAYRCALTPVKESLTHEPTPNQPLDEAMKNVGVAQYENFVRLTKSLTPMVRLKEEEVEAVFNSLASFRSWSFTGPQREFANALQDAWIAKNGGK